MTGYLPTMVERTARVAAPAVLALFAALGVAMTDRPTAPAAVVAAAVVVTGVVLAWLQPRTVPLLAGLAAATAGLVYLGFDTAANLAWMGLCVVAAWVSLSADLSLAVGVAIVLMALPVSQWFRSTDEPGWFAWTVGIAFTTAACVFARRLRLTVEQLRAAQASLAERSRAQERTRIAAEVHDVLGHALTVAVLHIGSARLALDEDPAEADRRLAEAERVTRTGLDEVRASVGLMRADASGTVAPLPDARALPELVASFREAGTDVDLEVAGDAAALGPTRGLATYRIAQEALTNATRHAPGSPVTVRLDVAGSGATLTVRNAAAADPAAVAGSGIQGMRERAEALGGRCTAGPSASGWSVEAVLP